MRIYASKLGNENGSEKVRKLLAYGFRDVFGEKLPEIAKTKEGKPYFPSCTDVHFSLSHTDTYVMCALSDKPVGCDIQAVRPVKNNVIERVCTDRELALFDFIQLWTLKESWIKLNGALDRELKSIEFSGTIDNIISPTPVKTARLYEVGDCVAAVCSAGDKTPLKINIIEMWDIL